MASGAWASGAMARISGLQRLNQIGTALPVWGCMGHTMARKRLTAACRIAILDAGRAIGRERTMAETAAGEATRGRFENIGRRMDEHFGACGDHLEDDVKRVITYLNDKVVPEVRQNSSKALRIAAEQLGRLADHLDRARRA